MTSGDAEERDPISCRSSPSIGSAIARPRVPPSAFSVHDQIDLRLQCPIFALCLLFASCYVPMADELPCSNLRRRRHVYALRNDERMGKYLSRGEIRDANTLEILLQIYSAAECKAPVNL